MRRSEELDRRVKEGGISSSRERNERVGERAERME